MLTTTPRRPTTTTRWLHSAAVAVVAVTLAACGTGATTTAHPAADAPEPDAPTANGRPDAIHITVPSSPPMIADPVPLAVPVESGDGVEVRIAGHDSIEVVTGLPGEVGGPAVALAVEFVNRSADPVDLANVTVDLILPGRVSAHQVTVEPADPASGWLGAGERLTGTYVFAVPVEQRSAVDLTVRYSADVPTLVFSGSLIDG